MERRIHRLAWERAEGARGSRCKGEDDREGTEKATDDVVHDCLLFGPNGPPDGSVTLFGREERVISIRCA